MNKSLLMIGMVVGSIIGGYIPTIFGASVFSIWSIILSGIFALIGIWITYRMQL
jgi:hypothetical protein